MTYLVDTVPPPPVDKFGWPERITYTVTALLALWFLGCVVIGLGYLLGNVIS